MKIPGIWGGFVGPQVLESLPFLAFPHEICCISVFLKLWPGWSLCSLCEVGVGTCSANIPPSPGPGMWP